MLTDISVQGLVKSCEQDKNILDGLTFDVLCGGACRILGGKRRRQIDAFQDNLPAKSQRTLAVRQPPPDDGLAISQIPVYPEKLHRRDVLKTAHERIFALEAHMNELAEKMARDSSPEHMRETTVAAADFESFWRLRRGSGAKPRGQRPEISAQMRGQLFSKLSGGEKTRVNLCQTHH
jgi:hypothetical protein